MTLRPGPGRRPEPANILRNDLEEKQEVSKMTTEISKEQLTNIASKVGARHGFDSVEAEFSAFRDFKMKWTRSFKWISLEVADYLKHAPEDVLEELFGTVFRKIESNPEASYTTRVREYLTSEDFVRDNQPVYVKRFRGAEPAEGRVQEVYRDLVDEGLLDDDPNIVLLQSKGRGLVAGAASALMHVAMVNRDIAEGDDEDLLRYVVFAQARRIQQGFSPEDPRAYERGLDDFPNRAEAESKLRKAGLRLN